MTTANTIDSTGEPSTRSEQEGHERGEHGGDHRRRLWRADAGGAIALIQMVKSSVALGRLDEAGVPTIALDQDPVMHELATRLTPADRRHGPLAAHRSACRAMSLLPALLAVGLALMLLGAVTLSPALAAAGIVIALVTLALVAWPAAGRRSAS